MDSTNPVILQMRSRAEAASMRAYAPYSGLAVGAAVLTEGGEIFTGCNVENASFSLTMCAERSAVFQAVAAGHRKITAVVIATSSERPIPPCGACRQVLIEFGPDADVFSFAVHGDPLHFTVSSLLPNAFRLD